ncbi:hypothetical protein CHUAL_003751 [Chamberlinius hualienensis]
MDNVHVPLEENTGKCLTINLLNDIRAELKADRQVPNFMRWLMECLESTNDIQQVGLVKQISLALQKSCTASSHQVALCIRALVQLYLRAECSHVIKRAITSTLQSLPQHYHAKVVESLGTFFKQEIAAASNVENNYTDLNRRHLVDNITSCLDNFSLGIVCISEMDLIALKFLHATLEVFTKRLQDQRCPPDVQKACLDCQTTVRAVILLLQKAEKGGFLRHKDHVVLRHIIDILVQLLVKEENSLDCRCNCGMAVILLARLYTNDDFMRWLYNIIFSKNNQHSNTHNDSNGLLSETTFDLLKNLTTKSAISIVLGLLSALSTEHLMMDIGEGKTVFFDMIFPYIVETTKQVKESSLTVITSRATLMWTKRAKEALEESSSNQLINKLRGDGDICCQLLEYVWTHWEHYIDSVRHGTRDIFDNVLTIHVTIYKDVILAIESAFIQSLFSSLMKMPWHFRGKYGALCCFVRHFGARPLLQLQPTLPQDLLKTMDEAAMHSYATELFECLFMAHKIELRSHENSDDDWNSIWVMTVIKDFNRHSNTAHLEHILTKLLKCSPNSLNYIMDELVAADTDTSTNDGQLRALIVTAKTARNLGTLAGLTTSDASENADKWNSLFPLDVLKRALCHVDDDIRLGAFTLLCDSPKTTEIITKRDLDLIISFLQFNMANQSPKFRQKLLAHIKRLILRVNDSNHYLKRQINTLERKNASLEEKAFLKDCSDNYRDFLNRLVQLSMANLFTGANFPRRGLALGILKILREAIGFHNTDEGLYGLNLKEYMTRSNIQTLLECFKDTYEVNKGIALDILKELNSKQLGFNDANRVAELFETAMQMTSTTRPQDEITASYLFRLLSHHRLTVFVAMELKRMFEEEATERTSPNLLTDDQDVHVFTDIVFAILEVLSCQLKVELKIAKKSLLEAASNGPMHGVIFSIRHLLMDLNFSELMEAQGKWHVYLSLEVDTDEHRHSQRQLEPLSKSSTPDQLNKEPNKSTIPAKSVTSQMVLLCGWRTVKEISLLLGDICQRSIEVISGNQQASASLLMVDQILQVGNFFITLLAETIHRGAFEQGYLGFKKLCDGLSRSSIVALYSLPEQWLSDLFEHIKTGERGSSLLCSTRRSAGIPFMVQALVTSGSDSQNLNCFKQAMFTLLQIGLNSAKYDEQSKVHAFNILRALYRDTRLGEVVTPFVAEGLQAAICGFKARSWAVRNSATLLFSSLITRIFGVKRSKDELSKKNCMTGNIFFQRYPSLYQFLLDELKEASGKLKQSTKDSCSFTMHPSLYPVLMMLARLYPSSMEGTQTSLKLSSFVPYVIICAQSSIHKTRVLAAKALVPLVAMENIFNVVSELLQWLPNSSAEQLPQNTIHGVLLQVYHLFEELPNVAFPSYEQKSLRKFMLQCITDKQWLCTVENSCPATKVEYLRLIDLALSSNFIQDGFPLLSQLMKNLENELSLESSHNRKVWIPGHEMLLVEMSKIYLRLHLLQCESAKDSDGWLWQLEGCLKCLLQHWSYEVRWATLRCLCTVLGGAETDNLMSSCDSVPAASDMDTQNLSSNIPIKDWKIDVSFCRPWIETVIKSNNLNTCLLSMISSEDHPDCLAQLCYLLPSIPTVFTSDWPDSRSGSIKRSASEKMELILLKGECEPRNDVRCALLHFLGFLIPKVYDELIRIACVPRRASVCENVSPPADPRLIMNEWTEAFLICCSSEQSLRLRFTATQLLVRNAYNLLVDPNNCLGSASSSIWSAAILLLQDDEPFIRYTAAKIVEVFPDKVKQTIQPELAVDIVLGHFVSYFGRRDQHTCLTMLLDWMLKQNVSISPLTLENEEEERTFDRGQANIYFEEVQLTKLLQKHLTCLLYNIIEANGHSKGKNITESQVNNVLISSTIATMDMSSIFTKDAQCQLDNSYIKDIKSMILDELALSIEDVEIVSNQTPFSSYSFDSAVVRLFRVIAVVYCLAINDKNQRKLLRSIQSKLMDKLASVQFYNRMMQNIVDRLNTLCKGR